MLADDLLLVLVPFALFFGYLVLRRRNPMRRESWSGQVGWLTIAGPLIVWLVKKDSSPFVRNAAAGAFNFTLTMWLISFIGWILTITVIGAVIGVPMVFIGSIGSIVLGIYGAIKAWGGEAYTYPWQLRVLS